VEYGQYKMQAADCGQQTRSKMQTADYRLFYVSCYFHDLVQIQAGLFRLTIVKVCTLVRPNVTVVSLNVTASSLNKLG